MAERIKWITVLKLAHRAIDDEPEVPGPMPDEMWEAIRNDRDAMERAIRIGVQLTKQGIRDRLADSILAELPEGDANAPR